MLPTDGVRLCSVLYASHATVSPTDPERVVLEQAGVEVAYLFGAQWHKLLGTGVLAVFTSASAAMRAAAGIQQRATVCHPEHLPAIGVSTGEALLADDDPMGMMVVVAARLASRADPGQVLVCDVTVTLANDPPPGAPDSLSPQDLKGVQQQVLAGELGWMPPPDIASAWGVPEEARHVGPFAGRTHEIELVSEALTRLRSGSGGVVVVTGEAGAGKSAFIGRLVDNMVAAGQPLLYGRCDEHVPRPYQPIAEMVRRVCLSDPRGSLALGQGAGELSRVVTEVAARYPLLRAPLRADADAERRHLLDAFSGWCEASAAVAAAMVVDDVHWADPGTLDVIRLAATVARTQPLLLIVCGRPTSSAAAETLVDLRRDGALDLHLGGLTEADIATLAPPDTSPLVVSEMHRRSGGNSFYVRELLRALDSEAAGVPDESVRQVVMRRLAGLSEPTRKLLASASVMGLRFDALVLVDIGAADDDSVLDLLEESVDAGVVVERVQGMQILHEFVHALTREALYSDMSALRRARLHQQLGKALEQRSAPVAELARHFVAAVATGEAPAAVRYTLAAADEALLALANEQALAGYRQAAELLVGLPGTDPAQRIDVDIRIGECLRRLGHADYLPMLFGAADAADGLGDGRRMAAALLATYRGSFQQAFFVNVELIARLERALELLPEDDEGVRAALLARLSVELSWSDQLDRARSLSDEAVAIAERLDGPSGGALLARVLILRQWTLWESLDERLQWQATTEDITTRLGDPGLRFEACDMAYFNAERAGDGAGAQRAYDEAVAIAEQLGSPIVWWNATRLQSTAAARLGHGDERVAAIDRAYVVGKAAMQPDATLRRAGEMFWVDFEHGELDAQRETMTALWRLGQTQPFGLAASFAHRCLEVGLSDVAAELYQGVRSLADSPLRHHTWLAVQVQLAHVAAALGDVDDAMVLQATLEPFRDEVANMWFTGLGSVARYLGHTRRADGDLDGAVRDMEHALTVNERVGAVTWHARTSLDLAELLRQRASDGDLERADALVADAATAAERHRLPVVTHRARLLAGGGGS